MPDSIVFVGTTHVDRRGPQRLSSMLGLLQPDIIAIEIDTKRAQYLDRWLADPPARVSAFLKKYPHSYPETVAWIVKNYVYEYRESGDYCRSIFYSVTIWRKWIYCVIEVINGADIYRNIYFSRIVSIIANCQTQDIWTRG